MSVVVEFTLPRGSFAFGPALAPHADLELTLEAIVPTGHERLPFVWATDDDQERLERSFRSAESVERVTRLDEVGRETLYHIQWSSDEDELLAGLAETCGVVLAAVCSHRWHFRVRFRGNEDLRRFHEYCTSRAIPIRVDRVYQPSVDSRGGRAFELTPAQREALVLAVDEGYFSVPRGTDLSAIADALGISQQAASKRVRRGADAVLRASLPYAGEQVDDSGSGGPNSSNA